MNADDRQLIAGMFERISTVGNVQKDADAEAFIHECMRQSPDSPYLLVQSVLVQEQALQKAGEHIKQLEAKVSELENKSNQQAANQKQSSVVAPRTSAGFGGKTGASGAVPAAGRAPWQSAVTPNAQQKQQRPGERQAGGGGFMAQAMTTAAGVAGGMLLASGISSLLSGGSSPAEAATPADAASEETAAADANEPQAVDASQTDTVQDDAALQETSSGDDGGFFGGWGGGDDGGDWGGGDFDI